MAGYKDRQNYVPHDLNDTVVTVDGSHNIQGLDSIMAEYDDDHFTFTTVGDGTAQPVKNPSRKGTITLTFLEASSSSNKMWDLCNAANNSNTGFNVSVKHATAPRFNINDAYCYPQKPSKLERTGEPTVVEWVLVCGYLTLDGGGYALQAA